MQNLIAMVDRTMKLNAWRNWAAYLDAVGRTQQAALVKAMLNDVEDGAAWLEAMEAQGIYGPPEVLTDA